MNSKVYKWCLVSECKNTSKKNPNMLFVYVPTNKRMRDKWLKLARRDPTSLSQHSSIYFCEDHFDLQNDMLNYMEYHVMGTVSKVLMKPDCIPSKFDCYNKRKQPPKSRKQQYMEKEQRLALIGEFEKDLEEKRKAEQKLKFGESSSNSSVELDTLSLSAKNNNDSPISSEMHNDNSNEYEECMNDIKQEETLVDIEDVCRACLAVDVKMYHMSNYNLKEMYEQTTGTFISEDDSLPKNFCYECTQRLINGSKFREKSLLTQLLLNNIMTSDKYITKQYLQQITESESYLKSSLTETSSRVNDYDLIVTFLDVDIKFEPDDSSDNVNEETAQNVPKQEMDDQYLDSEIDIKEQFPNENYFTQEMVEVKKELEVDVSESYDDTRLSSESSQNNNIEIEYKEDHLKSSFNMDVVNNKRIRQKRYREQNREKLKQKEAERRKRKQNMRKIQANNGLAEFDKTNKRKKKVQEKNALQMKRERQQRYREQNREKARLYQMERRRRLKNLEVNSE